MDVRDFLGILKIQVPIKTCLPGCIGDSFSRVERNFIVSYGLRNTLWFLNQYSIHLIFFLNFRGY